MSLDAMGMSESDASRALLYALNKFAHGSAGSLCVDSLASGLQSMLKDTKTRIASFRDTLASRGFDLHFQPIVGLDDLAVHHQEALTRMPDGTSPFAMVTFAEEAGFITDFDLAVVRRAAALLEANSDALGIAVNISGRSLESSLFVSDLEEVLERYVRNRRQLLIEITESHRVENFTQVGNVLNRLGQLGHTICIDDFGSGAAAFQYLRAFKIDVVKIDGLFIRDIDKNSRDQAFVRAMQRMCSEMRIEMIAEMIEGPPQADMLKSLGVQFGQGYMFGKARPQLYRQGKSADPRRKASSSDARFANLRA
jgi:EAL domain-containing protein (putative c-di-GMP-specific phosphodiesterase class I)